MVTRMSPAEAENWAYRADVAEQAIRDRHAARLWGLPGTNLAVPSWPAPVAHKAFFTWHYWWQAHYLDCLIDAALRVPSREKSKAVQATIRGIRLRNLSPLASNKYYDDRAWMVLALGRAGQLGRGARGTTRRLLHALVEGIDPSTGVLPWREGDVFFNVPSNGPAAIAFARAGRLDEACALVDWVFDNLVDDSGLILDGERLSMGGVEVERGRYTYNQGVMIGACLEVALALRERGDRDASTRYLTRLHTLIHSVAKDMATPEGVIKGGGGGDGGLFNGILMRYMADAAVRLPADGRTDRAASRIARRLVLATANSAWQHRLEVDGLPLFPADWTKDATFPQAGGLVAASVAGAVREGAIRERDLSVQLSGWMLMEAAARVGDDARRKLDSEGSGFSSNPGKGSSCE
ncbi:Glycosyl hydrolase family 76 [Corynebacterium freneyi]|nr:MULTISPECIES: glycoside hydrolase family 76 protein [Corynebacterium]OFU52328.1 glycoside hydrolase family 76 [Corynebacterium sp. HMSC11E11]UBI02221.1 glycoside hydrolase family 76 [Corynebacterium freneyi]WJZ06354.1 Glycosyl hydrolase family 76 [Corynebacterium freneyi]